MPQILENEVLNKNMTQDEDKQESSDINDVIALPDYELFTGFDEERLAMLEMMLGSRLLVLQAVKKFAVDFSSLIEDIHALILSKDLHTASRKLHTLKGCAAELGANNVSALASEIEELIKHGGEDINQKMMQLSESSKLIDNTVKTLL